MRINTHPKTGGYSLKMAADETTEKSMPTTEVQQQQQQQEILLKKMSNLDLEEGEIVDDEQQQNNNNTQTTTNEDEKPKPETDNKRHVLENSWTFWFDNPSTKHKQAAWGSNIRPIHTYDTVEHFWGLYNNIRQPSKLGTGADFYCFKDKIEPKWEDPICANGGNWTMTFPKGKSDTPWLHTLLAMIGEQFDHNDEICGAVVNVRSKQEKISIWTKNAANEAAQLSIGRQWKKFLDYSENMGFIFHEDAMKLERNAKNKYTC